MPLAATLFRKTYRERGKQPCEGASQVRGRRPLRLIHLQGPSRELASAIARSGFNLRPLDLSCA